MTGVGSGRRSSDPARAAERADDHDALRPLWRGLVAFRVVALGFAVVNLVRYGEQYASPVGATVVVALMAGWTVHTSVRYLRGDTHVLARVDLGLTLLATLSTLLVETPAQLAGGTPVITTVWAAGGVLAVALADGVWGGLAAAAATVVTLFAVHHRLDAGLVSDAQLLAMSGGALGYAAETLRRSARRLREAIATEATTAERERLARDIHDGVLQVLAYVRRRGHDLGEPGAELADLAGDQEVALRRLITTGPVRADGAETDLAATLGGAVPARVSLALPPDPVLVPAATAAALAAVVSEAVANAAEHAGPEAGIWVLLEDIDDAVTVTVRDDGVGIAPDRLATAEADGHLGVASSIRGRVRDLGGTAELVTAPGEGTEWEVRVPRPAKQAAPGAGPTGRGARR